MTIAPWQIPILVMAAIVGPTSLFWAVRWLRDNPWPPKPTGPGSPGEVDSDAISRRTTLERSRALVFAVLTTILVAVFVGVLGEQATGALTAVLTAIPPLVSAVLAIHSVFLLQDLDRQRRQIENKPPPEEAPTSPAERREQ